jgi:hypothetical protein
VLDSRPQPLRHQPGASSFRVAPVFSGGPGCSRLTAAFASRYVPGAPVARVGAVSPAVRFASAGGISVSAWRDFAVAAKLASQAFGTRAASVAGTYGVLMLIAGALAAAASPPRAS